MTPKHYAKASGGLAERFKQLPKNMKRALGVLCSAAILTTSFSMISMTAGAAQATVYAKTTAYLNLRSGAGTGYSVIKVIDTQEKVTVLDHSNSNWLKIKLSDGTVGYSSADYLDITTDAKTTDYLNLRRGPGTGYGIITTIAPNVKVDVISFAGSSWAYIKMSNGTAGYVCTDYLSFIAEAAQTTNKVAVTTGNAGSAGSAGSTGSTSATSNTATNTSVKAELKISATKLSIAVGNHATLTATTNTGGTIRWSTSNSEVVSVTSKGVITGLSAGTATVTALDTKNGRHSNCTVTVVKTDVQSIKLAAYSKTMKVGNTYTITTATNPANAPLVFSTSNKSVATVSSKGLVTAVSAGTANITVSDKTGVVKAVMAVTVQNKTTITLSASSASVNAGNGYRLTAKLSDNSAVTWTSSNTTIAAVTNGMVSGLRAGTATITAADSTGKIKASCKVTVNGVSTGSVSLSRYTGSLTAGKTLYIKGYASGGGTWSSADPEVATVSSGFIRGNHPGKTAISYTDYYGNRRICVVTVYHAAPIRFTYASPNSAVMNSPVKLVAITDKNRTIVKFTVDVNGTKTQINASTKKSDGNTYIWTASYTPTKAGTFQYTASAYDGHNWSSCDDGKADIYVSNKTDHKQTSLSRLRASDDLIAFIGEKEGFVSTVTYDTIANNLPTLGYGFVVWEGDTFYNGLTKSEGFALLADAVNNGVYSSKVNDMLINNNVRFNQRQFDALVSFSYNLGTGWTGSSDLKSILLDSYGTVSDGTTMTGTVIASDGLNVRKSATTNSEVVTTLRYNEKVTLVSTTKYNSVWYKVKTSNGTVGYCSGTYLRLSTSGSVGRDLNYVNRNALIDEMLAYHHSMGNCYYGLLYRRADELEIFFYGDYVSDGRSNKHNFPDPPCISFP